MPGLCPNYGGKRAVLRPVPSSQVAVRIATGLGLKVGDEFTVPLYCGRHRQLHQADDKVSWWNDLDIHAIAFRNSIGMKIKRTNLFLSECPHHLIRQRLYKIGDCGAFTGLYKRFDRHTGDQLIGFQARDLALRHCNSHSIK